jgi:hypothetical protein
VTEQRPGSAGKDRGEAVPVGRDATVTDGIDTTVYPVQSPRGYFALDAAARVAQPCLELADRDHAVLPLPQSM